MSERTEGLYVQYLIRHMEMGVKLKIIELPGNEEWVRVIMNLFFLSRKPIPAPGDTIIWSVSSDITNDIFFFYHD